jgi:hypothetical protein
MSTPLMLRGLIVCGLLLCGCQRDIRKLHIEKRIYRPGWYVSIPPRGEPITHSYPPPAQTPVVYPSSTPSAPPSAPPQRVGLPPVSGAVANSPAPPQGATPLPAPPLNSPPAPPQASTPAPPQNTLPPADTSSAAVADQPQPPVPDSTTRITSASSVSLDVQGGFRVFAAGLVPVRGHNFPLAAGAGFAGGGFTLACNAGARLRIVAVCSYRYARLPVKYALHRPLPLPETAAGKEKLRFHTLCTETALCMRQPNGKFIRSIDAGLGIERMLRSAYISKSSVQQPLPGSGQESFAVTKTKATRLYGLNGWTCYITGGISHAGWRLFFNYRINKQTMHETDFPRMAFGVSYSTFDF